MIYALLRRALFAMDAEAAHEWTTEQMRHLQQIPIALRAIERICRPPGSSRKLLGLDFRSPIGIAAGFDKNAVLMPFLAALGFGFVEVGTVTPRPQSANPKPRMFRDPAGRALVNRLGFNNLGVERVVENLRRRKFTGICGVNIGKNRDTAIEHAGDDYEYCFKRVAPVADYVTLNLSSPNTPGLR